MLLTPEIGILIPILILCVVTTILKPNFLTWRYISSILVGSVFIGAATMGESLVIMSGEIDLSVGMNGCLAGVMCGLAASSWGLGLVPCVLICLLSGAVVGAINGLCVCYLGLSSWITTLATQFICQGLAVTISDGEPQSIASLGLSEFTRAKPLGLSWLFFIFVVMIILLDVLIRRTRYGYSLRSVGGNQEASVMAGINARHVKLAAFILAGVFAAAGGLFDTLNAGAANAAFGNGQGIPGNHLLRHRRDFHERRRGTRVWHCAGCAAVPYTVVLPADSGRQYQFAAGADRCDFGAVRHHGYSAQAAGSEEAGLTRRQGEG